MSNKDPPQVSFLNRLTGVFRKKPVPSSSRPSVKPTQDSFDKVREKLIADMLIQFPNFKDNPRYMTFFDKDIEKYRTIQRETTQNNIKQFIDEVVKIYLEKTTPDKDELLSRSFNIINQINGDIDSNYDYDNNFKMFLDKSPKQSTKDYLDFIINIKKIYLNNKKPVGDNEDFGVGGGGKYTYNGRKYTIRIGTRGGKYILVNKNKKYIA